MIKVIALVTSVAVIGMGTAFGFGTFQKDSDTPAACRCCGDQCSCEDCPSDELGCACDAGGPCFCSGGCCDTCCDGEKNSPEASTGCSCCGDECSCVNCQCDALGCACDTGGPCFCSGDCCSTCCGK